MATQQSKYTKRQSKKAARLTAKAKRQEKKAAEAKTFTKKQYGTKEGNLFAFQPSGKRSRRRAARAKAKAKAGSRKAYRASKKTGRSKYQQGGGSGMYADNVIPAGIGSTAMTVYQEDNPEIQRRREAALAAELKEAEQKSEEMSQEIKQSKEGDKAALAAAATAGTQEAEAGLAYGTQALKLGDQAGLFGEGKFDAATQAKKDKQSLTGSLKSARDIYRSARHAKKIVKSAQGFNKAKAAMEMTQRLRQGEKMFGLGKNLQRSKDAFSSTMQGIKGGKMTMQGFKTADQLRKTQQFGSTLGKGSQLASTIGADGYATVSKGTEALAKGSAIGKGLKDFATSGAGIGLIASGLGAGAQKIWGDDDPTKYNAGEIAGDVLSGIGTGMSTGAMLGTVVPGIGNVVGAVGGAIYGLGKGLIGQKKAKKEKAARERKRRKAITKYNKEVSEDLGSQMIRARAGELRQKRYSGYDLGRNLTAQRGGYRGMPRYAY